MKALAILALLSLAACSTSRGPTVSEQHDAYCREIGLAPKTQAYADCRLKVLQTHASSVAAANQADAIRSTAPSTPVVVNTAPRQYDGYGMPSINFGR
jgi:hypothetical protein